MSGCGHLHRRLQSRLPQARRAGGSRACKVGSGKRAGRMATGASVHLLGVHCLSFSIRPTRLPEELKPTKTPLGGQATCREFGHHDQVLPVVWVRPGGPVGDLVSRAASRAHSWTDRGAPFGWGSPRGSRPDVDPDDLATTLWAALSGLLALAWKPGDLRVNAEGLDRLPTTFVAMVADGLRTRPD